MYIFLKRLVILYNTVFHEPICSGLYLYYKASISLLDNSDVICEMVTEGNNDYNNLFEYITIITYLLKLYKVTTLI